MPRRPSADTNPSFITGEIEGIMNTHRAAYHVAVALEVVRPLALTLNII